MSTPKRLIAEDHSTSLKFKVEVWKNNDPVSPACISSIHL